MNNQRIDGKVIVVTGSTKGIGKGIARYIGLAGGICIVSGRDEEAGRAVVEEINGNPTGNAAFIRCDVSSPGDCKNLIESAVKTYGRLDGLVNNAAIDPSCSLLDTDEEVFDRVFSINAKGSFFCTKYAIAAMADGGSIVHIGSTHGFAGSMKVAAYSCSKGALRTLTQHVAKNYAEMGIRSNWITVGWVITDKGLRKMKQRGHDREWMENHGKERMPLGRMQTNEDIASAVIYLLSDESAMVTGSEIHVTGGFVPNFGTQKEKQRKYL